MNEPAWPAAPPSSATDPRPPEARVAVGIVGAGIHGAALARELTLRGVDCALVDRGAVGGGTSQWSTKLLHGGIRYLATGDIAQMREGLRERATWVRIAPGRCRWEAFWMPHEGLLEGLSHRIGIGLYDHWGAERPGWPAGLRLGGVPRDRFEADPRAQGGPFRGAVAYADLLTWDRLLVRDLAASSQAARYDFHDLEGWTDQAGRLLAARLRDRRDGTVRTLAADQWVIALGPWTDRAMSGWFQEPSQRLRLSAGIHLWLDPVPGCERPWALRRPGGRILFAIPRDGLMQVGTTEREVDDGWVPIVPEEREFLYQGLEGCLPAVPWRALKVHKEELGVRPLTAGKGSTVRLAREAVLERHPQFQNLRLVLGGKLTTARALMDRLATEITGRACPESRTRPLAVADADTP